MTDNSEAPTGMGIGPEIESLEEQYFRVLTAIKEFPQPYNGSKPILVRDGGDANIYAFYVIAEKPNGNYEGVILDDKAKPTDLIVRNSDNPSGDRIKTFEARLSEDGKIFTLIN